MKLIRTENHFGNYNNYYEIQKMKNIEYENIQLAVCYVLCQNEEISISDIFVSCLNKSNTHRWARRSYIRYDKKDFHQTFKQIDDFVFNYNNEHFGDWCVIFYTNNQRYSISGKNKTMELQVNSAQPIDEENIMKILSEIETDLKR